MLRILLLLCLAMTVQGATQCLNQAGHEVDWWTILKIPVEPSSSNVNAKAGVAYVYLDSTALTAWQAPSASINASTNALSYTLKQVYSAGLSSTTIGHIMYDDQDPSGTSHNTNGHTKGVWGFDKTSGFWLTHSVPRYPPLPNYYYPDIETTYGQSFLCISLSLTQLNNAAENLLYTRPYIFSENLPSSLSSSLPNMVKVTSNSQWITGSPYTRSATISTLGGAAWLTFAKNAAWNNELWDALVAPGVQSNLLVETWMNGSGGKINSTCSTAYQVLDVSTVTVGGESWSESKDHSKWGVSSGSSPKWGCVGDINRVQSQANRGGGALCLANSAYAKTFQSVVTGSWPCEN